MYYITCVVEDVFFAEYGTLKMKKCAILDNKIIIWKI